MNPEGRQHHSLDEIPEIMVEGRRGISIVWLIPLVAVLIGGWLTYKTITEMGPTITITFQDGAGLEAGKTKIKYKSVEIGEVETIQISQDLSRVIVTAHLGKHTEPHLTENTQFWVVRPRIGVGGIEGLETIVSGSYIAADPRPGPPARAFTGLEQAPEVTFREAGSHFHLRAQKLGSLHDDAPLYFRDIEVGKVLGHQLAEDGQSVLINVFIRAPHHLRVRDTSRFWKMSGIEVSVGAEGVDVKMGSLASLLSGGVAFDTPVTAGGSSDPSQPGTVFDLFESFAGIAEASYVRKIPYLLHFDGSVRGLSVGAPVEFRGIKVGSVTDIAVELNTKTLEVRVPVVIEIEPDRVVPLEAIGDRKKYEVIGKMVERGLRAQLQTGSLLTGQLFVELEFHPKLPRQQLVTTGKYPAIPTVPATMDELRRTVTDVLAEVRRLPLDKIAYELLETVKGTKRLANSPELLQSVRTLTKTLDNLQKLTGDLDKKMTSLAPKTEQALEELAAASRSIRVLADYLERHPEALVRGK